MFYAGSNVSNGTAIVSEPIRCMGRDHSLRLQLPPLGGIILQKTE